jgi:hypothetical protein
MVGDAPPLETKGKVADTDVTVPTGVAQVPSPRQKVVEDAPTPEFKWVTAKFPDT